MKKTFLIFAAFLVFATSFGQVNKDAPIVSCSSDCLLGDCRIKCPASSVPSCTCVVGVFSSCKCLENVMSRVKPVDYELIVKRNDEAIRAVCSFLSDKKDTAFTAAINGAYSALKENNQGQYDSHLATLENLVKSNPKLAEDIYRYVQTLK